MMIVTLTGNHTVSYEDGTYEELPIGTELIKLEPGEIALSKKEVSALAHELSNVYISYNHSTAREAVKKICHADNLNRSEIKQQQVQDSFTDTTKNTNG